jgi:hypothetical protein
MAVSAGLRRSRILAFRFMYPYWPHFSQLLSLLTTALLSRYRSHFSPPIPFLTTHPISHRQPPFLAVNSFSRHQPHFPPSTPFLATSPIPLHPFLAATPIISYHPPLSSRCIGLDRVCNWLSWVVWSRCYIHSIYSTRSCLTSCWISGLVGGNAAFESLYTVLFIAQLFERFGWPVSWLCNAHSLCLFTVPGTVNVMPCF